MSENERKSKEIPAPSGFTEFMLKLVEKKLEAKDLAHGDRKSLEELRDALRSGCKNSVKIATVDLTDDTTTARVMSLVALLMTILTTQCDSPVEAYTACHLVQDYLGRAYNIAGIQGIAMQTDKLQ